MKLYNSLNKKIESILSPEHVKYPINRSFTWYLCGPTVYDHAHLGHARTFITMDLVKRYLTFMHPSLSIHQAMSITDVDDKIINKSKLTNTPPHILTNQYKQSFIKDMNSLYIQLPMIHCHVTDYIPEIIEYIHSLLEKRLAYIASDNSGVYFDISQYESKMSIEYGNCLYSVDEHHHSIGTTNDNVSKKDKRDFALWKNINTNDDVTHNLSWESPWGIGRPGWHIECSVMSNSLFGNRLDFHSGGIDLKFPHHENEITQCNAHNNTQSWCNFWFHSAHLVYSGDKMSKSLGNVVNINQFLEQYHPNIFRIICLQSHYSKSLILSDDRLQDATRIHDRIQSCLYHLRSITPTKNTKWTERENIIFNSFIFDCYPSIILHMKQDLNTHSCVEKIQSFIKQLSLYLQDTNLCNIDLLNWIQFKLLDILNNLLGLSFSDDSNQSILQELIHFRKNVRRLSLDHPEIRKVGLELCDDLRSRLKDKFHISIKDT